MSASDLKCGELSDPPETVVSDVDKLANELGMSETCKRSLDSKVKNSLTTADIAGKVSMGIPFGPSASLNAKMTTTNSELNTSFVEEGCGSFILDSKEIMQSMKELNCTLNTTSTESRTLLKGRVSVSFEIDWRALQLMEESLTVQANQARDSAATFLELSAKQTTDKRMQTFMDGAERRYKEADAIIDILGILGSNTLENTSVTATSDIKLKMVQRIDNDIQTKLESSTIDIVKAAAQNTISQELGTNAMQGDTKMLINERVESHLEKINQDMTETLNSMSIDVDSSSSITFSAAYNNLKNATIHAGSVIDMHVSNITSNAIRQGKTIANELIKDLSSTTDTSQVSKGQEEVLTALGLMNQNISDSHNKGFVDSIKALAGGGMMAAVAGMVVVMGLGALSGSKGEEEEEKDGMMGKMKKKKKEFMGILDTDTFGRGGMRSGRELAGRMRDNFIEREGENRDRDRGLYSDGRNGGQNRDRDRRQDYDGRNGGENYDRDRRQDYDGRNGGENYDRDRGRNYNRDRRPNYGDRGPNYGDRGQYYDDRDGVSTNVKLIAASIVDVVVKIMYVVYVYKAVKKIFAPIFALAKGNIGGFFTNLNPFPALKHIIRIIIVHIAFKMYCMVMHGEPMMDRFYPLSSFFIQSCVGMWIIPGIMTAYGIDKAGKLEKIPYPF